MTLEEIEKQLKNGYHIEDKDLVTALYSIIEIQRGLLDRLIKLIKQNGT